MMFKILSEKPLIRAYLGDCTDFMAETPDKYYGLSCCDPPYGIGVDVIQNKCAGTYRTQNGGTWKKYHDSNWDSAIPGMKYFSELKRISENQIIWGGNFFNNVPSKCWIIWDKIQRDNRADGEMAWTSFNKPMKIFSYSRADAYINYCDIKIHPTQKPVALYLWLLTNYAKPGQTILDTHGGSFSSAIACHKMGFDLDIVEIDEEYFNSACSRFKRETKQMRLF